MDVSDVDGDGFADVLYGADYGGVSVAFGPDQFRIAPMPIRDDRKYSIATGDVDGNGTIEVVVGAGSWETGHLHVVDPVTLTVRWTSRGDAGPFYGIAYGDVDANGAPDLLHTATADVASDPPYAGGGYFVYGAQCVGKHVWDRNTFDPQAIAVFTNLFRLR